jgi:hypothetical protein
VLELGLVASEMAARLAEAQRALMAAAAPAPPGGAVAGVGAAAAQAALASLFPPPLLAYRAPREPGLLGFTGPTAARAEAVRQVSFFQPAAQA